jgi:uncharacterized membrane protein
MAGVVRALWFVPALMAAAGVLLGFVMPFLDAVPGLLSTLRIKWVRVLLDSAPAGAQQLLSTSAGALATILGVAFSLTLVTLQLAAAQYTPRLIGRLLDDRVTKFVLGSYIGTVAYLLLVLRSIRGVSDGEETFVPRLSILLGLFLILGCLGLLAYFVHHLGESIQAANVGASVVAKTARIIRRLRDGEAGVVRGDGEAPPRDAARVVSRDFGYVQLIDLRRLASAVPPGVTSVRLDVGAGDYVLPGSTVARLWPCTELGRAREDALLDAMALGPQRTEDQDILFGVRQLADVALKALSPGVNDETTAVTIVNQLGSVLAVACEHFSAASRWTRHQFHGVTIVAPALTVRRLVEDAFAGLIRFSAEHPRVLARIVEVFGELAARQPEGDARAAIEEALSWVQDQLGNSGLGDHERRLIGVRLAFFRRSDSRDDASRPHAMH